MEQFTARTEQRVSRGEFCFAGFIFTLTLILRFFYAAHYRIDSDEPQHLHVVWAWTQGLLPYRDVFDNHSPLFQLLSAPVFAWLGERPDIIVPMRLLMIVPFCVAVWAVGGIGHRIASLRVGLWSAVFAALYPRFFFGSSEYRPDDLWACIWLIMLLTAISGQIRSIRSFFVGLLLGFSFCVSMKTTLMLIAMALAMLVLVILEINLGNKIPWSRLVGGAAAALGGALIFPGLTLLIFRDALPEMYYCVIQHNIPPSIQSAEPFHILKWIAFLIVPLTLGFIFYRRSQDSPKVRRAWWIGLVALFYFATLKSFWPILTDEDYLPSDPLAMGLLALAVLNIPRCRWTIAETIVRYLPHCIAFSCIITIFASASPFQDRTRNKISMIANVLRLTKPDDYVMDSKGETIYRRRPFYYVMEGLTGFRMKSGLIKDDIIEKIVETGTPVATVRRMPAKTAEFIRENYLPIAFRLSVLGKWLSEDNGLATFKVMVPGSYVFMDEASSFSGTLNGKPITGPEYLFPGEYQLTRTSGTGRIALFWSRAAELGYNPFNPPREDKWTRQD
jgi:hypothetical protein